jgi:hypothetical protein
MTSAIAFLGSPGLYLGWLLWKISLIRLDWFNEQVRNESIQNHRIELCSLAALCYNDSI